MEETDQQLFYEVGCCRLGKETADGRRLPDAGGDGLVFVSSVGDSLRSAVAVVCDGISEEAGSGDKAVRDYVGILRKQSMPWLAFLALSQEERRKPRAEQNASTFVGLDLPHEAYRPVRVIVAGDSGCARWSEGEFRILTKKHTVWQEILELDYPKDNKVSFCTLDEVGAGVFSDVEVNVFIKGLELAYASNYFTSLRRRAVSFWDENMREDGGEELSNRLLLDIMVSRCRHTVTVDIASTERRLNEVNSPRESFFELKVGDIWMLFSDGMDVGQERIEELLRSGLSPVMLAKLLAEESSGNDDVAVVVVKVLDKPSKQEIVDPCFNSIQPDAEKDSTVAMDS